MSKWIDYRSERPASFERKTVSAVSEHQYVTLPTHEAAALKLAALMCNCNPYKVEEQEAFIAYSKEATEKAISSHTRAAIKTELRDGFGAVVVCGLPTDDMLPQTPPRGGSLDVSLKEFFVAELCLIALGTIVNAEPFNFHQEGLGSAPLIDNVVPVRELRSQRGGGGYDNNFPFHCESTWHRLRPDYLVLLGIRGVSDAQTLIFSVSKFQVGTWPLSDLPQTGWFRVRAPDLYIQMEADGIPMGTSPYSYTPPVFIEDGLTHLNLNLNGTDCRGLSAVRWLARLEDLIEESCASVTLTAGSAIILDNRRTCHTRTGYNPAFSGHDRWLIRGNFKCKLWPTVSESHRLIEELDRGTLQKMIDIGWISKSGEVCPTLTNLIRSPYLVKHLDIETRRLAAIAFQLTPVAGLRIV